MIPGDDYIYQCTKCDNLISRGSLVSGNTLGGKLYSDGKNIAPMLPEFPDLVRCGSCNTFLWLSKLTEIGTRSWDNEGNHNWKYAQEAEFPEIDEYFEALAEGVAGDKEEEVTIRQSIWWAYNDRIRYGEKLFADEADEHRWKDNCHQLMLLLDPSDINEKIMIAEINRNLGNFKQCAGIIQSIDEPDLYWAKQRLLEECDKENRWLVELD